MKDGFVNFDAALEDPPAQTPEVMAPVVQDRAILPDLDRIREAFKPYAEAFKQLEAEARALTITNKDQEIHANDFRASVVTLLDRIEKKRKALTEEPFQWVRRVNDLCKIWTEPLGIIKIDIDRVLAAYLTQVRIEAQRKENEQRKALEEMQRVAEEKAKEAGVEAPPPIAMPIPVTPQKATRVSRGTQGSTSLRDHWDFEIVNLDEVERRFLMINEKAVKAEIAGGLRETPGLRIFNDPKIVGRR